MREVLLGELAPAIMETEKSHKVHLHARDPGNAVLRLRTRELIL
jgi:hypothetical protein